MLLNSVLPRQQPSLLPPARIIAVKLEAPDYLGIVPATEGRVFQLLDCELRLPGLPSVTGIHARKLATLCGYEANHPFCDTDRLPLPARAPAWKDSAVEQGLVASGLGLDRGGGSTLAALSAICAARGSTLRYHTVVPKAARKWLKQRIPGNVKLVDHASMAEYNTARKVAEADAETTSNYVPQGAAWADAEPGVRALARNIEAWWQTRPGGGLDIPAALPSTSRGLDVVLPAGSGATALFLQRHLPPGVIVWAVPCQGDAEGLVKRMEFLDARTGAAAILPRVLAPPTSHAVKFGAVSPNLLASWRAAAECGVLLDLVYGPVAWGALEECGWRPSGVAAERDTLYINTGGHEGIEASLGRYKRAGLLNKVEVGGIYGETTVWYNGQWDVKEVASEARRVAASRAGLVHTRDAGL